MTTLDRLSKAAVALSIIFIIALQMALHPDMTWMLRALTSFSLIFGWLSGRMAGQRSHTMWLIIAPLAPAALLAVAGREGPVVELVWIAGLAGALLRTLSWSKWSIPDGWKPLVGGWALTVCLAGSRSSSGWADSALTDLRPAAALTPLNRQVSGRA